MMYHQEKAVEEYPLALLYQKYAKVVLSYLDRRISIKEDAEDLLLEVFHAAWSPDGRYIVSAESIESSAFGKQSYVVKVWVA
jgi:DNA-directed RNA polymerase specialized sigma24 family protein